MTELKNDLLREEIELKIQEAEAGLLKNVSQMPKPFKYLVVILAILIIPAYFIAKSISASVWRGRLAHMQVAAKPSFNQADNLEIGPVNLISLGQKNYAAYVQLKNSNLELSLNNVGYELRFLNSTGQTVHSVKDKFYILPNRTKYLMAPKINASETVVSAALVLPEKLPWQKRLKLPKVSLTAIQPRLYTQTTPLAAVAEGDFRNNSAYHIKKIRLYFFLNDKSGKTVAISQRDEFDVKPYEKRAYKQLWPNTSTQNISSVRLLTETNLLDSENFSSSEILSNPASNLARPDDSEQN